MTGLTLEVIASLVIRGDASAQHHLFQQDQSETGQRRYAIMPNTLCNNALII